MKWPRRILDSLFDLTTFLKTSQGHTLFKLSNCFYPRTTTGAAPPTTTNTTTTTTHGRTEWKTTGSEHCPKPHWVITQQPSYDFKGKLCTQPGNF
jgi:hypothetical protein